MKKLLKTLLERLAYAKTIYAATSWSTWLLRSFLLLGLGVSPAAHSIWLAHSLSFASAQDLTNLPLPNGSVMGSSAALGMILYAESDPHEAGIALAQGKNLLQEPGAVTVREFQVNVGFSGGDFFAALPISLSVNTVMPLQPGQSATLLQVDDVLAWTVGDATIQTAGFHEAHAYASTLANADSDYMESHSAFPDDPVSAVAAASSSAPGTPASPIKEYVSWGLLTRHYLSVDGGPLQMMQEMMAMRDLQGNYTFAGFNLGAFDLSGEGTGVLAGIAGFNVPLGLGNHNIVLVDELYGYVMRVHVPEPATLLLLSVGLMGFAWTRNKRP